MRGEGRLGARRCGRVRERRWGLLGPETLDLPLVVVVLSGQENLGLVVVLGLVRRHLGVRLDALFAFGLGP